jgi:predicted membrane channel-forming protein YqfA (hemolysin III family)
MLETPADLPQAPQSNLAVPAEAKYETPVARTSPFVYLLAIVFGLFSGWVNEKVDDALLTSLCVLGFTMILGVWKKGRPWRWLLLVWGGVPLVLAYYQYVVRWPHDRSQWWGAFLQILAASAGANGGHYMRDMIDHVFLKKDA